MANIGTVGTDRPVDVLKMKFRETSKPLVMQSKAARTLQGMNGGRSIPELPKLARLECGPRPTKPTCFAWNRPCLFDNSKDPCEYHDLADLYPNTVKNMLAKVEDTVKNMLAKVEEFRKTAVAPGNKPGDPKSNPKFHGGAWVSWKDE
ncbi:Uncharacterised protein g10442 [Pycnogonum litorale]